MHVDPNRWRGNAPGGIDKLNTFWIPDEFDNGFPLIKKFNGKVPDELIPFRYVPRGKRAMHFFLDDYRFECVWNRPGVYAEKYRGKLIFSPDFSLYTNYPIVVQIWNVYRNRWVGAYFQSCGIYVIPTITWGNEESFDFCFSGVEPGGYVAITTKGCSRYKNEFTRGFDEMVSRIEPELVLCAGELGKVYLGDYSGEVITYILGDRFNYKRV